MIYQRLGRAAIRFSARYLRARYRRQLRIGVAMVGVAAAAGIVASLTTRDVPEG